MVDFSKFRNLKTVTDVISRNRQQRTEQERLQGRESQQQQLNDLLRQVREGQIEQRRTGVERETVEFEQGQTKARQARVAEIMAQVADVPQDQQLAELQAIGTNFPKRERDVRTAIAIFQRDPVRFNDRAKRARAVIDRVGISAKQQAFQTQTEGLSPEDVTSARRIDLGLDPRAVGSAAQTIASTDVTEDVAASESLIKARVKQAERQAGISADVVKNAFKSITTAQKNIRNLDRAAEALRQGAQTGAIAQFLPSIAAATRELEQIQSELGLDVVGSVTFGALSKGELNLALTTALDLGQEEPILLDIIERKKAAQEKLILFYRQAASFLSGINPDGTPTTVAQFMALGQQRGEQQASGLTPEKQARLEFLRSKATQ